MPSPDCGEALAVPVQNPKLFNPYTVGHAIGMLVLDSFLYAILAWYLGTLHALRFRGRRPLTLLAP